MNGVPLGQIPVAEWRRPPVLDLMQAIVGVRFFGISRAVFRYLERCFTHDAAFRVISRAVNPSIVPQKNVEFFEKLVL
ncbi:MAG: hypothetical protein K6T65_10840 [Peptococcaceae bacterium]|nr:hypothetical protein [Peptococcaceae bacterium]